MALLDRLFGSKKASSSKTESRASCSYCSSTIDHFGFTQDDAMKAVSMRGDREAHQALMRSIGGTCSQCSKICCSKCYYDQKFQCPNCKAKIPELGGR